MKPYDVTDPHYRKVQEYLMARGISPTLASKLGIEILTANQIRDLGFKNECLDLVTTSFVIPVYDIHGEVCDYQARLFYRKSFVDSPGPKLLHRADTGKKPPSVHFSSLVNWHNLETNQRVYLCESVLKASVLAHHGFHAIGFSGCWGWSKDRDLHWSLRDFEWEFLKPVAIFDSNVHESNPKLAKVLPRLQANMSAYCGVDVGNIPLPPKSEEPREDWGVDDYFAEHGKDALVELLTGKVERVKTQLDEALVQLNKEVVIVRDKQKIYDRRRHYMMPPGGFKDVNFADRKAESEDGDKVPVAKIWLAWDKRSIVDTMLYEPGSGPVIEDQEPSYVNLWTGWGTVPREGDVSPFTEWLQDAFPNESEREWIVDWLAYPIQNPGAKMNSALMLVGESGTGKGFLTEILTRIYGHAHTWKERLQNLESHFNAGLAKSSMVVIEETDTKSGSEKVYNILKDMITNPMTRLEMKGVDASMIASKYNLYLQSNHINALPLESFDRRFGVFQINGGTIANCDPYWEWRWDWVRDGGDSVVMRWLLERDLSEFNPHGKPPETEARQLMSETSRPHKEIWIQEYCVDGEPLYVGDVEVTGRAFTSMQLLWMYYGGSRGFDEIKQNEANGFGQLLGKLGVRKAKTALGGTRIKINGSPVTLWVIKGSEFSQDGWNSEVEGWFNEQGSRVFGISSDPATGLATPKY
jgi:hypothetical protein